MQFVLLSYPTPFAGEVDLLTQFFEAGLERFHLRRDAVVDLDAQRSFISSIPAQYHQRIALHTHHELCQEFDLGGLHFKSGKPTMPHKTMRVSAACHSFEDIARVESHCDYVFLSPIFDSVSKVNYKSAFEDHQTLQRQLAQRSETKVIALGGISSDRIPIVESLGFDGAAALGAIWEPAIQGQTTESISVLKSMMNACQNVPTY